jgi:hypothetical protein
MTLMTGDVTTVKVPYFTKGTVVDGNQHEPTNHSPQAFLPGHPALPPKQQELLAGLRFPVVLR